MCRRRRHKYRRPKSKKASVKNTIARSHSLRGGAGAGYHSGRRYSRRVKHKKGYGDEIDNC